MFRALIKTSVPWKLCPNLLRDTGLSAYVFVQSLSAHLTVLPPGERGLTSAQTTNVLSGESSTDGKTYHTTRQDRPACSPNCLDLGKRSDFGEHGRKPGAACTCIFNDVRTHSKHYHRSRAAQELDVLDASSRKFRNQIYLTRFSLTSPLESFN